MWPWRETRTRDLRYAVLTPSEFSNLRHKMWIWLLILTLSLHLAPEHASLPLVINTWPFKNATAAGKTAILTSNRSNLQPSPPSVASQTSAPHSAAHPVRFAPHNHLETGETGVLAHELFHFRDLNSGLRTWHYFIRLLIFCHGLLQF